MSGSGASGELISERLLERGAELARLEQLARSARAGTGGLAVIAGPAGIGKTRLLEHACVATRGDVELLRARGGELERTFPYGVVRQLFEPALRRLTAAERRVALRGEPALAVSALGRLDDDGTAVQAPGEDRFAILHGLHRLTANLARRAPLLMAIDDVQWSDASSLGFVTYLARRVADLPVLVLLALRTGDADGEDEVFGRLIGDAAVEVLEPAPLSEPASATLVRELLAQAADGALCRACHRASGGNPFLLRELALALGEQDVGLLGADAEQVARLAPAGIRRMIVLRLARLPAGAAALVRAVAVLGDGVELSHAAALAGLDPREAASEAADVLTRAQIFRARRPLEFVHPVIRESIHADLLPGEQARAHTEAARILQDGNARPEQVAAHLLVSEVGAHPWAVAVLRQAAEQARARAAPTTAITYLRRALGEPGSASQRTYLLRALAASELLAGREAEAVTHLRAALETASDDHQRARIALKLGRVLTWCSQPAQAVTELELAASRYPHGDTALELQAELIASARAFRSTAARATPWIARHDLDAIRGDTAGERMLLAVLAVQRACAGEPVPPALDAARRALAEPRALYQAAIVLILGEDYERTERHLTASLRHAMTLGSVPEFITAACYRAWVRFRRGALDDAESDARGAVAAASDHGRHLMHPAGLALLVDVLIERDALEEAERIVATATGSSEIDSVCRSALVLSQARLRLAQGRLTEAVAGALSCGEQLEAFAYRNPALLAWRATAAYAMLRMGEASEAGVLADEEVRVAERFGAPRALGAALRIQGLARGGAEGLALLERSAKILGSSPARLEHAWTLSEQGAMLRRSGARAESRAPLRLALELAQAAGATALVARTREELTASGVRVRGPRAEALTPSERRICELAADGRSNRAIAQGLFLSLKTVEMHLSHAYRKLGINRRAQLPAALAALGDPAPASAD